MCLNVFTVLWNNIYSLGFTGINFRKKNGKFTKKSHMEREKKIIEGIQQRSNTADPIDSNEASASLDHSYISDGPEHIEER